jgi:putative phage-type endonuclease
MPTFHDLQQGSAEWLAFRKDKITATDIGVIMGISPYKSPYMLWQEKLGLKDPELENDAMRRGKELEPIALKLYCDFSGWEMEPRIVTKIGQEWAMASLDGISKCASHLVEIKCPGRKAHEDAKNGDVNPLYIMQMNWQMYCADVLKCDYWSFDGEIGYCIPFSKDHKLIDEMIVKAKEFLEMMRTVTPPPFTDLDYEDKSEDAHWDNLMAYYRDYDEMEKKGKLGKEHVKKLLIEASEGRNCKGSSSRFTKVVTKGRIQYEQIELLKEIDLEQYRGPNIESYRISLEKE